MSEFVEFKLPFIFSSSTASGALNVSPEGSSFGILFDRPLVIPRHAHNCYITVQNATCWWNFFNIFENVNDQIRVYYDDGIIIKDQVLTIDPGLYDLDHLEAEISRLLLAAVFPQDLFVLLPDEATQKIIIQYNYTKTQINFTDAGSPRNFRDILGFNDRLVPLILNPGPQILTYEKSDNVAQFNNIEYILIHSDLVSRGIKINDRYSNTLAQVLIDKPPGEQLISSPFNPPQIPSKELIGEKRKSLRFWLTDQDNNLLNTNGEQWSLRLVIHYSIRMK